MAWVSPTFTAKKAFLSALFLHPTVTTRLSWPGRGVNSMPRLIAKIIAPAGGASAGDILDALVAWCRCAIEKIETISRARLNTRFWFHCARHRLFRLLAPRASPCCPVLLKAALREALRLNLPQTLLAEDFSADGFSLERMRVTGVGLQVCVKEAEEKFSPLYSASITITPPPLPGVSKFKRPPVVIGRIEGSQPGRVNEAVMGSAQAVHNLKPDTRWTVRVRPRVACADNRRERGNKGPDYPRCCSLFACEARLSTSSFVMRIALMRDVCPAARVEGWYLVVNESSRLQRPAAGALRQSAQEGPNKAPGRALYNGWRAHHCGWSCRDWHWRLTIASGGAAFPLIMAAMAVSGGPAAIVSGSLYLSNHLSEEQFSRITDPWRGVLTCCLDDIHRVPHLAGASDGRALLLGKVASVCSGAWLAAQKLNDVLSLREAATFEVGYELGSASGDIVAVSGEVLQQHQAEEKRKWSNCARRARPLMRAICPEGNNAPKRCKEIRESNAGRERPSEARGKQGEASARGETRPGAGDRSQWDGPRNGGKGGTGNGGKSGGGSGGGTRKSRLEVGRGGFVWDISPKIPPALVAAAKTPSPNAQPAPLCYRARARAFLV